jgi:hypothetical protein
MQYRDIRELKKLDSNPRVIRDKQFKILCQSIKDNPMFFEARPLILSNRTGFLVIIAGNQRYEAAKYLKLKQVPTYLMEGLTEEKEKEIIMRDNISSGEFDMDALANSWSDLPLGDWGLKLPDDWLKMDREDKVKEIDLLSDKPENLDGKGMVHDLKENVRFDGVGIYDFPELRPDMILDVDELSVWAGPNATHTEPPYLYNYATDSTNGLPWDKTVVSFYTGDERFEKIWANTAEPVKRMLNKKIIGCITPNFSTYFSYPKAMRIYNIFRSRWVGRYMQEAGLKVIPDITCGINDLDCVIDGIPCGQPIAMQAHRKYNPSEKKEKNEIMTYVLENLKPSKVFLYAGEDRRQLFPILNDYNVLFLTPRTILQQEERQRKEVKSNG